MHQNVTHVMWFNNIGIVRVDDLYDGPKYYIKTIIGINPEEDKQSIAEWGSTFPDDAGYALFGC